MMSLLRPWVASCHETADRLLDYVDGELEGRTLARVRRHLARCERCRALLESLTRALDQLRSLGSADLHGGTAPATLSGILARIEGDEREVRA